MKKKNTIAKKQTIKNKKSTKKKISKEDVFKDKLIKLFADYENELRASKEKLEIEMSKKSIKNAVMYTRSATTGENGINDGIQRQVCNLIEYAKINDYKIIGHFGGVFTHPDRKEFDKMLAFIKQYPTTVKHVLVENQDRLSRNITESFALIQELKLSGIELISITQNQNEELYKQLNGFQNGSQE